MNLPLALLSLLGGFAILLFGGEVLLRAAVSVAVRTKIPAAIISLTIVAAGTSAPELVTSLIAAFGGTPDIAVGNVIGSNIFNILAILGISFLVAPPKTVGDHHLGYESLFLLIFTIAVMFFGSDLIFSRVEGIIFTVALVAFLYFTVARSKGSHDGNSGDGEDTDDDVAIETLKTPWHDVGYLLVGLAALVGGADLALKGGIFVGKYAGLSDKVIGLTIISAGTGLPEFATSAVAAFRNRADIALGNVIGSNILNTLGVLGFTSMIHPLSIAPTLMSTDSWLLLAATMITLPIVFSLKWSMTRFYGGLLFIGYITYVVISLKGVTF